MASAAHSATSPPATFPPPLESYVEVDGLLATLEARVAAEPFNAVATLLFFAAILHTFLAPSFGAIAHRLDHAHRDKIRRRELPRHAISHRAELMHFLGEVEVVFGLWSVALIGAIVAYHDWGTAVHYLGETVNFTEPSFVVVIMTLAASRPVLLLAESTIARIARIFGGSLTAMWFSILTVGPVLGSFITEPAAMTISALLLGRSFYALKPSSRVKYGTLGLLLVNVSVGGTLTHFAAPPVLMVSGPWHWSMAYMFQNFGWKAIVGILLSNGLYYLFFRRELRGLEQKYSVVRLKDELRKRFLTRSDLELRFDRLVRRIARDEATGESIDGQVRGVVARVRAELEEELLPQLRERGLPESLIHEAFDERFAEIELREMRRLFPALLSRERRGMFVDPDWDHRDDPVPLWVTVISVLFMAWTIVNAHHPQLFMFGMLFFLGFAQVTADYQNRTNMKPPMLVGFFLAGLVIHGGLQGWWIAPILGSLESTSLMGAATILTAFNDNAAITYLATLVPSFTDELKYAVVAGAVTGGGLTIIANAPNPAGISLLKRYFGTGVSAAGLAASALIPTGIMFALFWLTA